MPPDLMDIPNIADAAFAVPGAPRPVAMEHRPRILLLYGSLRERSYSRFATLEAARLLAALGAEARIFDPTGVAIAGRCARRTFQGSRAARAVHMVRGASLVQS